MNLTTIILFFIYTWGLGFIITSFIKSPENFLEKNLMRIGIGLGLFPILSIILNTLHIPLDWKIFLILSLVFPFYYLMKNFKKISIPKPSTKITKSTLIILIVLLIFLFTFLMYHKGAFAYPWLEDSDPWAHAEGVKYISIEKKAFEPFYGIKTFHYIDPYPPSYDILMGILHQTSPSINWTLKFFNALIISLGIIFFYFFVKEFTKNRKKALFSTFVLAAIPCYLSHFIWSHALIITLIFPAIYALEKIKQNKKWGYVALFLIASLMVIQPTQIVKIIILIGIYWIVKAILNKNLQKNILIAWIGGILLSILFWWGPMVIKYGGVSNILTKGFGYTSDPTKLVVKNYIGILGTGSKLYTFSDFVWVKTTNMINNPIGVGLILSLILIISLVCILIRYKKLFSKESPWLLITLLWLIFTFLGIHGGTRIPIALVSFRFWMLFAIPAAILSSQGAWFLMNFGKKNKVGKFLILVIIIIGILLTSGYQKYSVNTAQWPFGGSWSSMEELGAYVWLKNLPDNTKVFPLSGKDDFIIGFDKFSCSWCKDVKEFRKTAINRTPEQLHSWLKSEKYEYFLIGGSATKTYPPKTINEKINELGNSPFFSLAHQTKGAVIFKIA